MNPEVQKVIESAVVNEIKKVEQTVDDEINRLDKIDEDGLEQIRQRRLAQMKREAEQLAQWRRDGHGSVHHVAEKDFFTHAKRAQRMVAVFYRKGTSRYTDDLLEHIARVAQAHLETLFITLDAEKSPFLTNRLNIRVMPSIILTKNGEIEQMLVGLDRLCGSSGKFSTVGIERRLFELEMITNTNIGDDS